MTGSWKLVVGFFILLAAGVAILEFAISPPSIPQKPQPAAQTPPELSANMQVLPQVQEMERQVATQPNNSGLILQLANLLHDNRFYDKAIQYYRRYLGLNEKDPNARVDMGICYKELGNTSEARKEMTRALTYDPRHVYAHFNLGIVNLIEGNVAAANVWFRKTVDLAPNSEIGKRAAQLLSQHSSRDLQTN